MGEVGQLIAMLMSSKADKRYHACEELRVMPTIPEDAWIALQAVMNDPDALVADAARRARQVHTRPTTPSILPTPAPQETQGGSETQVHGPDLPDRPILARLVCDFITAPSRIRDAYINEGPATASIAASLSSLLALVVISAGLLIFGFGLVGILVALGPSTADFTKLDVQTLMALISALAAAPPLLLGLAAVSLAIVALFKRGERKSRALGTLILGLWFLIWYSGLAYIAIEFLWCTIDGTCPL